MSFAEISGPARADGKNAEDAATAGVCRVFLYGYFGFGNTGDTLLLHAATAAIARRWPRAEFVVRNLGPVPLPADLAGRITLTGLDQALEAGGPAGARKGRVRRLLDYLRDAERAMSGCRVFVLAGGTLLHVRRSYVPLVLMTLLILMARMKGLRVVAIGLGVRGFDGALARSLLAFLSRFLDDIAVRDAASAVPFPASAPVRVCADLVYGLWPPRMSHGSGNEREDARAPRPCLSISLSAPWPPEGVEGASLDERLAAGFLRLACEGWSLRFLVFQDGSAEQGGLSDHTAIDRVRAILERHGVVSDVVAATAAPEELAACYAGSTVHFGARFHGLVLASLMRVPFVGLAIDPKISSLCQDLAMPVIDPLHGSPQAMEQAVQAAAGMIPNEEKLARFAAKAEENYQWFSDARMRALCERDNRA